MKTFTVEYLNRENYLFSDTFQTWQEASDFILALQAAGIDFFTVRVK